MLLSDVLLIFLRTQSLWLNYGTLLEMAVILPLHYMVSAAGLRTASGAEKAKLAVV